MRSFIIPLLVFCFVALFSCNNKKNSDKPAENDELPEALQENKKRNGLEFYKRDPGDLVENIYRELEKEDPLLKELSEKINILREQKKDSLETFITFENKNISFYTAARHHNGRIEDSALKHRIQILINQSFEQYNNRIQTIKHLIKLLDSKTKSLNDLHETLKIIRTLPIIEKYQQTNLPTATSLEAVIKGYNSAIQLADSLIDK